MNSAFGLVGNENPYIIERRAQQRFVVSGRALVQVVRSVDKNLIGKAARVDVLDVSQNGLQLSADTLLEGCEIDMWIKLEGHFDRVYLVGNVVWSSPRESSEFHMGVSIQERRNTQYIEWKRIIVD